MLKEAGKQTLSECPALALAPTAMSFDDDHEINDMRLFLSAMIATLGSHSAGAADGCPLVAGWIETATISDPPLAIEAKLDTGAQTSALGSRDLTVFRRNGTEWVRFTPQVGDARPIETPLTRWTRVRRAGAPLDRRPVVTLPLCLAGLAITAEVTLTDRTGLDVPMLVGREALAGRIAVDPGRDHVTVATCPRR
jgi:hypothetical protein